MSATAPRAETQAAVPEGLATLRALVIAHGAFNVLFGVLLIAIPGRTLTLIAVLAGISLCLIGVVDIAGALLRGLTGAQRAATVAVGLLALAAGIVVMARPEGSLRVVVVAAGLYLVIWGLARIVLGEAGVTRGASVVHGGIALIAGVVLLVWPDVTVGAMAIIYGIFLLALGVAEIYFAITRRNSTA
jgi:uncharacterized membrane protein HdeD (DUF308 family)